MSDDSHGVEQVGVHYEKVLEFVERTGIQDLHFFVREDATSDLRFPHTSLRSASVASIKDHAFWSVKSSRDVVADG